MTTKKISELEHIPSITDSDVMLVTDSESATSYKISLSNITAYTTTALSSGGPLSNLFTAIKTVDGSGSGLDADLLDGQHGSYYAPLASPSLTGIPTAPTAAAGTNTTQIATTAFVGTAVSNLVASAPSTLDTLNELAAALGDDPNFATTVTNSIATRLPLAGGTMTGDLSFGDSDKAIFGAGSDLQIYHDGSGSYIDEVGTGSLYIRGTNLVLASDTGETYMNGTANGAVTLRYDNSQKLATTSTGIDVTGNITVSGTIDGRDVSADGSKLDSIETGANVTDAGNVNPLVDSHLNTSTASFGEVLSWNGTDYDWVAMESGSVTSVAATVPTGFTVSGSPITSSGTLAISYAAGYQGYTTTEASKLAGIESGATGDQTASEILTAIKTVDGSGSGLDADTLDGVQGSSYLRSDASDTATGAIYFQGSLSAEAGTKDDLTTRTASGFWQSSSPTTAEGWPVDGSWYHLLASTHSNGSNYYSMQFAGSFYNSTDIFYRSTNNSGTTAWNKLWHASNDGSGSGLDADLLDGQHGSYYAPLASPSLTGIPTAPTAAAGTSTTQIATTAFVGTAVSNLVDAAPTTLDTLNELAAALGDDPNFATTVTNSIATKLPLAGGTMTGNITFSGAQTVDGRDVSADGAKLDGIEAGATADQTASEILTAIKTVDGSGSGLDADTLDGYHESTFMRKSADASLQMNNYGISGVNSLTFNDPGPNEGIYWAGGNLWKIYESPDDLTTNSGGNLQFVTNATRRMTLDTSGNLNVTGSVNIGDGSADTRLVIKRVDGTTADDIQFYNGTTRVGEIGTSDVSWLRINQETAKNIYTPRYIRADGGFFVDGTTYGISGTGVMQSATGATIGGSTAWHAGNDGSGSGLDADLLDGVQGSNYLRLDTSTNQTIGSNFLVGNLAASGNEGGEIQFKASPNSGLGNPYLDVWGSTAGTQLFRFVQKDATNSTIVLTVPQVAGTLWSSGNDGSGSGLDADTVDGIQGASFLRSDADDSFTGTITNSGTFQSFYNSNSPGTNLQLGRASDQFMTFHGGSSGNFMTSVSSATNPKSLIKFGISTDSGSTLDSTYTLNGSSGTLWHTGNDGSGSGLDADLLDGQHGSYYQPASSALTTSTTFGGDVSGTYNAIVVANDSHTHDSRYYTESEIDTKLTDGTVSKLANQTQNQAGNFHMYVNDGGGNIGMRWNATTGGTNTLVENGIAYELEIDNDSTSGDWSIMKGSTSTGTAGETISWTEAFRIEGTDTNLYAYGSKMWTAGNDGSGSGLDADLWDGNQFSSYLNQAVLTTSSPTFAGLTINGTVSGTAIATQAEAEAGTNNDQLMTPLRVAQAIPASDTRTWQRLEGSRSFGTTYQNTTGRNIVVFVRHGAQNVNVASYMGPSSASALYQASNSGAYTSIYFEVPAGWYYKAVSTDDTLNVWSELR